MSDVLFCLYRISALIQTWDQVRGPGQALLPEDVSGILDGVTVGASSDVTIPEEIRERIATVARRLVNVLTDPVYLNDDRDREVIVARMALCEVLQSLRKIDGLEKNVATLWALNDCDAWCVDDSE